MVSVLKWPSPVVWVWYPQITSLVAWNQSSHSTLQSVQVILWPVSNVYDQKYMYWLFILKVILWVKSEIYTLCEAMKVHTPVMVVSFPRLLEQRSHHLTCVPTCLSLTLQVLVSFVLMVVGYGGNYQPFTSKVLLQINCRITTQCTLKVWCSCHDRFFLAFRSFLFIWLVFYVVNKNISHVQPQPALGCDENLPVPEWNPRQSASCRPTFPRAATALV